VQWWKVLGVAAFVGVAATGVLAARAERRHHDYTPEEIRARLHARAAEASEEDEARAEEAGAPGGPGPAPAEEVGVPGPAGPAAAPGQHGAGEVGGASRRLAEAGGAAPSPRARSAVARRRLAAGVRNVRTRLGVRPRPTPRRRANRRP
jgi:hypothetical protein